MTETKLAALRESVAHCAELEGLPGYDLEPFAQPDADGKCLCCGETWTFTWGYVHGEGHCYECSWPARGYHFLKDDQGQETRVFRVLQYHPDGISIGKGKGQ